jgi:predicted dehydrogenase
VKLRVGLVGLGNAWEKRYRPTLSAMTDRFEVRAVCENIGHRAGLVAAEFGATATDGFRCLARREDIDAVLLLSCGWCGPLPALAACEAGKAVYFGSGLDLDPQQFQLLKERVEASGIAFTAELPRRLAPATLRLKELIATGLGTPELIFCHQDLSADKPDHGLSMPRTSRSAEHELVELVDWCCYVVGRRPNWVTGLSHRADPSASEPDYRAISLDFSDSDRPESGPLAQISCGRYIPASWHEAAGYRRQASMQVSCAGGVAFVDLPSTLVWFDEAGRHQESLESERGVGEQLLLRFHRAVTSLVIKTADLDDALGAAAIARKAEVSHREGRRMVVSGEWRVESG